MKLLVLTDKYYPRPYANAACAQELIRCWVADGHVVDVLAYEDYDGMPSTWEENAVFYVKPDWRLRSYYYADFFQNTRKGRLRRFFANIISKSRGLILFPWQPFWSFSFPRRIYRKIEELHSNNHYDGIVAILKPLDCNIAVCHFKKKHPQIPYIVYCVDTMEKTILRPIFGGLYSDGFFWEKRLLSYSDAYFYMQPRIKTYEKKKFDPYRRKLVVADLPRFMAKDISSVSVFDFSHDGENWVYAGSLGPPHYAADNVLEVFEIISTNKKRTLHLFARGEDADRLAKIARERKISVVVHGYVNTDTLLSVMSSADVIVSIKTSCQISAKIFECMSYGKTIVHFSGVDCDPDVEYYKKYPLCFVFKMYDDYCSQLESLLEFLDQNVGKRVDIASLEEIFMMNTPEYSANKIVDKIKNLVKNAP